MEQTTAVLDQSAGDHDLFDIRRMSRSDDAGRQVVSGQKIGPLHIDHDQVGVLSRGDRPGLVG
jgi:hypothetical protein